MVIDSSERNHILFPNPCRYQLKFPEVFKNVTSIELKGSIIPKTEFNVNSCNKFIPFNLNDFITAVKVIDAGYGYVDGTYGFGAVPPNDALALITPPAISGGVQATITVVVANNTIISVVIPNPGTGYLRGSYGGLEFPAQGFYLNAGANVILNIPFVRANGVLFQDPRPAKLELVVGNEIVAVLNEGQYDFASPNDSAVGLCREVTRALQDATQAAITSGIVVPQVGGPQTGAEYFPYSVGNTNDGSCFLYTPNVNASENTNVAIQRGSDDGTYSQDYFLELLFGQPEYANCNAVSLLGMGTLTPSFKNSEFLQNLKFPPLDQTTGRTSALAVDPWESTPILGRNNYDLIDHPKYCVLSFRASGSDADRMESTNPTLNKGFATLVFDANAPEVVWREPNASATPGEGASDFSTLLVKPGYLKAIKGQDFDSKILNFGPRPIAEVSGIYVEFKKRNGDYYDFKTHDHLLIFEIGANDINSGNRFG